MGSPPGLTSGISGVCNGQRYQINVKIAQLHLKSHTILAEIIFFKKKILLFYEAQAYQYSLYLHFSDLLIPIAPGDGELGKGEKKDQFHYAGYKRTSCECIY